MENALVAAITLDFLFDGLQIREQISVGEHHAARLRRGARREYNLDRIGAVEHGGARNLPHGPDCFTKVFEGNRRDGQIERGQTAGCYRETHAGLLRNAPGERLVRDRVHGHSDRAAKQAAEKGGDPFAGVFSPEEDAIPFRDADAIGDAPRNAPPRRNRRAYGQRTMR